MGKAADHLAHGGETFALNDLLLELLFRGYVANGDDDAGRLALGIE